MQLSVRINDISKLFLIESLEVQLGLGNFVFILIKLISNIILKYIKRWILRSILIVYLKMQVFFFFFCFFPPPPIPQHLIEQ